MAGLMNLLDILYQLYCSLQYVIANSYSLPAEGKRPPGRPRRRWVDNIKIDLREIGWEGMDWIDLVQDRDQWRALVNTVMYLQVP
jgi:hypothetical protein